MGISQPLLIYGDNNTASIAITENCSVFSRTMYIDIRIHNIWEGIDEKQIILDYIPTENMIADMMTKPLAGSQFKTFRTQLGLTEN
mmetsp:Transcript_23150/g.30237  ORF Transcript_23150/g.30237 Transcript_23150/m.30237 type:complete len:86 (-) Transcript_23150:213-470(-)